ncbi:hypothetical protein Scep_027730 [Stephania cephalantha]|uniref:Uncharacterized protein n=1 Tax=Stephania cephalantha TaxID=152367 RepID=A0AAP0HHH8_9MAGN
MNLKAITTTKIGRSTTTSSKLRIRVITKTRSSLKLAAIIVLNLRRMSRWSRFLNQ